jgi:hypothetical protein
MMTHMKATAMARWFVATRGRAMSITNLGHPLGEAWLIRVLSREDHHKGLQQDFQIQPD